jgi:hypothetical protein
MGKLIKLIGVDSEMRGSLPSWGLGEGFTTSHSKKKKKGCYETLQRTLELASSCENGNEFRVL